MSILAIPTLEDFAQNYDTDVYLYPNPGAGIQLVSVPGKIGETVAVPVPARPYPKVRQIELDQDTGHLSFQTASGDWIITDLPFIIHRTLKQV